MILFGSIGALRRIAKPILRGPAWLVFRLRYPSLAKFVEKSQKIPGWTTRTEAAALALVASRLPYDAVVVEVGSFCGRSAVVLAGARAVAGSGIVHCVDPFDGSGDEYSIPVYRKIMEASPHSLFEQFQENLGEAGVSSFVHPHMATAEEVASQMTPPVDMLFLDGDQSPAGVLSAYRAWEPHLRTGAVLAVHNSSDGSYAPGHDGHRRLVTGVIRPPDFHNIFHVGTTTFAMKA